MFAYIKFVEDGIYATVDAKNIRKFDKANLTKKYMVKWSDDEYYPAIILFVKDTKEEIISEIQKRRVVSKPLSRYESASESGSDDEGILKKVQKSDKVLDKKKLYKNVLDKAHHGANKSCSESQKERETTILETYYENKKKEEENIKHGVTDQKESNKKEFDKNKDAHREGKIDKNRLKELERINEELKYKNKDLTIQVEELTKLNMSLQQDVINNITAMVKKMEKLEIPENKKETGLMEVGEIVGDELHIGQGIFLKKNLYDSCAVLSKTGSKFVKDISLAVFGVDQLKKSSVTGRKGNQIEKQSKPGLDPTKLQAIVDIYLYRKKKMGEKIDDLKSETERVKQFIASKISDLNRQARPKDKAVRTKSTVQKESEQNVSRSVSDDETVSLCDSESLSKFKDTPEDKAVRTKSTVQKESEQNVSRSVSDDETVSVCDSEPLSKFKDTAEESENSAPANGCDQSNGSDEDDTSIKTSDVELT